MFEHAEDGFKYLTGHFDAFTIIQRGGKLPDTPLSMVNYFAVLRQELCIQEDTETQWRALVEGMVPECGRLGNVFDTIERLVSTARSKVSARSCMNFDPRIPPHFETSLDTLVDDVDRTGSDRPGGRFG